MRSHKDPTPDLRRFDKLSDDSKEFDTGNEYEIYALIEFLQHAKEAGCTHVSFSGSGNIDGGVESVSFDVFEYRMETEQEAKERAELYQRQAEKYKELRQSDAYMNFMKRVGRL